MSEVRHAPAMNNSRICSAVLRITILSRKPENACSTPGAWPALCASCAKLRDRGAGELGSCSLVDGRVAENQSIPQQAERLIDNQCRRCRFDALAAITGLRNDLRK